MFDDDTPLRLIEAVRPDVLVKGADWAADQIVGREFVEARGGRVERIALREGLSTSTLVRRIREGRSAPGSVGLTRRAPARLRADDAKVLPD